MSFNKFKNDLQQVKHDMKTLLHLLNNIVQSDDVETIRDQSKQYYTLENKIKHLMTQLSNDIETIYNNYDHEYSSLNEELKQIQKEYKSLKEKENKVKKYKSKVQNKKRQIKINKYEISRYTYYTFILQRISFLFLVLLCIALLIEYNILPTSIASYIIGFILFISGLYFIYVFYDLYKRNRFNFNEYDETLDYEQSKPSYVTVYDYDKQHLKDIEEDIKNLYKK